MNEYRKYLDPETIAKLGNIELKARMIVEGFITGMHRSPYHGFSVEFSQHRQYRPGDEIRFLDWRVYARSGRYYIKEFEEETNLRCMIAIDSSASMKFSSGKSISKFDYSCYLAAALAMLMIQQRDAVGLTLYNNSIQTFLPANSRKSYISQILMALENATPQDTTGTAAALEILAERINRRGLVILFSDFFDDTTSIINALRHLRHKRHEVLLFQVLDDREVDFNFGNAANFIDLETGEQIVTQPYHIRKGYEATMKDFIANLKKECLHHQVDYNLLTTSTPFDKALLDYVLKRGKN
ncbi:MAG: DUF58 domain-containing protein [Ignavibacteria bacterium]|jgi:uncharacterized protein (DUF58 family)|nr:DUF58 domain-containing protein [Ignavibacteria bacterium]